MIPGFDPSGSNPGFRCVFFSVMRRDGPPSGRDFLRMNEENGAIRAIGTSQFEEYVLMRDIPVLVDFSARWCAPCRMLDAVLEQVAVAFAGRLSVVAVDVDRSAELADAFDVQSVPALMLIARGRLLGAWVGFQTAEQLTANLQDALARLEVLEDA